MIFLHSFRARQQTKLTTANMKNPTIFAVVRFELKFISETLILKF